MAKDKIETLADTIINLTPQEAQKLQVVIKAKMMPEVEKQKALLELNKAITHKYNKWGNHHNKIWLRQMHVMLQLTDY
jgi:nitric oxide synthase oxygenase domain/subunit